MRFLPSDRPISFLFLIIRHISALIDVYHRQMTFGLVCHYPMFDSSKLSYLLPRKSYWGDIVLQSKGQFRFTSQLCYMHQLDFGHIRLLFHWSQPENTALQRMYVFSSHSVFTDDSSWSSLNALYMVMGPYIVCCYSWFTITLCLCLLPSTPLPIHLSTCPTSTDPPFNNFTLLSQPRDSTGA